jgi:hypothetical protein
VLCEDSAIVLTPVEDLIADRLGQFCSIPSNSNQELLEQARLLIELASEIDWSYLERWIIEDQGDPSLVQDLRRERKPA